MSGSCVPEKGITGSIAGGQMMNPPEIRPDEIPEDQTLLTLYALAGEDSGGSVVFRPQFFKKIGRAFFPPDVSAFPAQVIASVHVRELNTGEMTQVERDLWIHYHQQKANPKTDRLFAAFAGTRLIGVARCSRHPDGLEVDAVFVLGDFRRRGFARAVMQMLVEECGRHETLFMHSRIELIDFYSSLGFRIIAEDELPPTIRDRFSFCLGELRGIDVCPMKREPTQPLSGQEN